MKPRRGTRVKFAPDPETTEQEQNTVAGLRFVVHARLGGEFIVDFVQLQPRLLALEFAAALRGLMGPTGAYGARSTGKALANTVPKFFEYLREVGNPPVGFDQLQASQIDGFESWLEGKGKSRTHIYAMLKHIIVALRSIADGRKDLSDDMRDRLSYISANAFVRSQPRDALDPRITRQIRDAARHDIAIAIRRIVTGPVADDDPRIDRLQSDAHAMIARHGVLRGADAAFGKLMLSRWKLGRSSEKLGDRLHEVHHLLRGDVLAFIIYLSLETGLELECCRALKVDCLRNPSAGTVEIAYVKNRSHGAENKTIRVRDRGSTTPGGLIRKILELTAAARVHRPSETLWVHYNNGNIIERTTGLDNGVAAWIKRHNLTDEDGKPFHLRLSQLRKTHKALWYLKTNGHMARFAVGHTVEIAAKHYANIPSLRPLHERTVVAALEEAARPQIVSPDEEERLRLEALSLPKPSDANALLSGDQDLWLASCSGFYASPFGQLGSACPTPFWNCLECGNAVITARKLPAILSFLAVIEREREGMTATEWAARFGRAHARIAQQVLPAFNDTVIEEARASLAADPPILYLPPEARV
jgi:hypothetical protein